MQRKYFGVSTVALSWRSAVADPYKKFNCLARVTVSGVMTDKTGGHQIPSVELEFVDVGFWDKRKTRVPGEKAPGEMTRIACIAGVHAVVREGRGGEIEKWEEKCGWFVPLFFPP